MRIIATVRHAKWHLLTGVGVAAGGQIITRCWKQNPHWTLRIESPTFGRCLGYATRLRPLAARRVVYPRIAVCTGYKRRAGSTAGKTDSPLV